MTDLNLTGMAFKRYQQQSFEEARGFIAEALLKDRNDALAYFVLGLIEVAEGRPEAGEVAFRRATKFAPDNAGCFFALGNALGEQGRFEEADQAYVEGMRIGHAGAEERRNHARILFRLDRFADCVAALEASLTIAPDCIDAWYELAQACRMLGWCEKGVSACRAGLAIAPDRDDLRRLLATLLLLDGRLSEGLLEYETRLLAYDPCRNSPLPRWQGEDLSGKKILIRGEQGMGDAIQMARFLPLLTAQGAEVWFDCHPCMHRLLQSLTCEINILTLGETSKADYQLPLLSLPLRLGVEMGNIPAEIPYLSSEPDLREKWRARLDGGFKVGLVWQGNKGHTHDLRRSFPLAAAAELFTVQNARFFGLQYEYGCEQSEGWPLTDLGPELGDYVDTAAILSNLDLLISCDTSTAHLAGALGVPTWLALDGVNDWRWMTKREDSPWYPGHRLFRQTIIGDWSGVFERMAEELRRLV
jgi:tetratricopeptide (TPR) repeat protein